MPESFTSALDRVDIIALAQTLGFPRPKGGRTRCILHEGDSPYSFSLDQAKGVWCCFACGRKGGKLTLVMEALRIDKKTAVQWLADYAGIELVQQTPADRKSWIEERKRLEERLPRALQWLSAFLLLTEELLTYLKELPVDELAIDEIFRVERLLNRSRYLDGPLLLDEFIAWKKRSPQLTTHLIEIGAEHMKIASYALHAFLNPQ